MNICTEQSWNNDCRGHIFGTSLKYLSKKWFVFSKMDIGVIDMLTLEEMKVDGVKQ